MRLHNYLKQDNILGCFYQFEPMNEVSDETFQTLRRLGSKVGLKIERSSGLIKQLRKAGKGMEDLLRYATLYGMTEISDKESRRELWQDMKGTLKHVNKREVADFFLQLDKNTLSLTSIPRHVLSSLFGIHISTYHQWKDDHEYIMEELKKIEIVLYRLQDKLGTKLSKEISMIKSLQKNMKALGEKHEG
jgi:hypothetical protein